MTEKLDHSSLEVKRKSLGPYQLQWRPIIGGYFQAAKMVKNDEVIDLVRIALNSGEKEKLIILEIPVKKIKPVLDEKTKIPTVEFLLKASTSESDMVSLVNSENLSRVCFKVNEKIYQDSIKDFPKLSKK